MFIDCNCHWHRGELQLVKWILQNWPVHFTPLGIQSGAVRMLFLDHPNNSQLSIFHQLVSHLFPHGNHATATRSPGSKMNQKDLLAPIV